MRIEQIRVTLGLSDSQRTPMVLNILNFSPIFSLSSIRLPSIVGALYNLILSAIRLPKVPAHFSVEDRNYKWDIILWPAMSLQSSFTSIISVREILFYGSLTALHYFFLLPSCLTSLTAWRNAEGFLQKNQFVLANGRPWTHSAYGKGDLFLAVIAVTICTNLLCVNPFSNLKFFSKNQNISFIFK